MTRVDRRALFTSGAAAALLAATGLSAQAVPKRGGTLRLAVPRDGGLMESVARGAVFDTLTEIAPDGLLRGELAKSWQSDPDARRWLFELRDGVTFHDGCALTATDVVASLAAHDLPVTLKDCRALGSQTLQIELPQTNPDLPFLLAEAALIVTRKNAPDSPANGTGLYRMTRFQEGRHFRAERVKDHYKDGQAGWVDQIDIVVIPDAGVRAEALRDGYVDVAALPDPQGLLNRGEFLYHPSAGEMSLAARNSVGMPRVIGPRGALDDGRIAERWWIV